MIKLFSKKTGFAGRDGVWPKARALAVLQSRYLAVEPLGLDSGHEFFGVEDAEMRFVVVLKLVDGAEDAFTEIYFLTSFAGFPMTETGMQAINANLHLSVLSFDGQGDLLLFGGTRASGEFTEGRFALLLDAWRRDLAVVIQGLTGGGFGAAFGEKGFAAVKAFATNRAPGRAPGAEAPADGVEGHSPDMGRFFEKFLRADGAAKAVCGGCGGRGKTGLIAKTCGACGGSGFDRAR